MSANPTIDVNEGLRQVAEAAQRGELSQSAVENITTWLTQRRYAEYLPQVLGHIADQKWKRLDDAFWTIIPFGTGGRRGRMYPIGSNAINDRTIGESAQGLANYVKQTCGPDERLTCAIAYDPRHRSRHFAEWCAGILVANGFKIYFLDDYRATPQLSFAIRYKDCTCGIMVTASHNPPTDNAVKVYWRGGAQVLPPHDEGIIRQVLECDEIQHVPFDEGVADGRIEIVTAEIDAAYLRAVGECRFEGPRQIKILYTPLHGVGGLAAPPVLNADGFADVELYQPHAEPNADFPNVPGNVSNPENVAVFDEPIRYARQHGHQLILATDPDADRLGCAAPLTPDTAGPWATLNGNQISALLADFVLSRWAAAGKLTPRHYIVKTLVTTELMRRIADHYGVGCEGDLLVGFKNIAEAIDRCGPERFVFGAEESHGYLVGTYARDKDGLVACMLMSELAAELLAAGQTPHDRMAELYHRHGYHQEKVINLVMEGSEGMAAMKRLMAALRTDPVRELGGMRVAGVRDYLNGARTEFGSGEAGQAAKTAPLKGPVGDMVIMDLEESGNYVAARPSGTEPKIKIYLFARLGPEDSIDLEAANAQLTRRLDTWDRELRALAKRYC